MILLYRSTEQSSSGWLLSWRWQPSTFGDDISYLAPSLSTSYLYPRLGRCKHYKYTQQCLNFCDIFNRGQVLPYLLCAIAQCLNVWTPLLFLTEVSYYQPDSAHAHNAAMFKLLCQILHYSRIIPPTESAHSHNAAMFELLCHIF